MKHTPGLWNKDRNMIEDSSGQVIAEVSYKQSGYVQGNAHLIAAAPDLLEACKEILRFYDAKELMPPDKFPAMWERVREAISKAEGEEVI